MTAGSETHHTHRTHEAYHVVNSSRRCASAGGGYFRKELGDAEKWYGCLCLDLRCSSLLMHFPRQAMACPQEGLPPRIGFDIIRAEGQDQSCASSCEGQGEGVEGGEGGRASGAQRSHQRRANFGPGNANYRAHRGGFKPLRRSERRRKKRNGTSCWRRRCTRRGSTG